MTAIRIFCRSALATVLLAVLPVAAHAYIYGSDQSTNGLTTATFNLTADQNLIQTEGVTAVAGFPNILVWTFNDYQTTQRSKAQYPSTTLIVKEGQTVTVNLTNNLSEPVSLLVPAFSVTAVDATGTPIPLAFPRGDKTQIAATVVETPPGGTVTYRFTASAPGTYVYQSGSNMAIQLQMGLSGALIVRPDLTKAAASSVGVPLPTGLQNPTTATPAVTSQGTGGVNTIAANGTVTYTQFAYKPVSATDDSTAYDREFMYIVSEVDPAFNGWVATVPKPTPVQYDLGLFNPNFWFVNGRDGVDTFLDPNTQFPASPHTGEAGSAAPHLVQANIADQPYNSLPVVHPGERLLLRIVNIGQNPHPIHTHGNFCPLVAVNGIPLSTGTGTKLADMSYVTFTNLIKPGETRDIIFTWTGQGLAFDAYGNATTGHALAAPYEDITVTAHNSAHTVGEMTHSLPLGASLSNTTLPNLAPATYTNASVNGLGASITTLIGASATALGADVARAHAGINPGALPVLPPAGPWVTFGMVGGFWSSPFIGVAPGTPLNPTKLATNATAGNPYPQESINNAAGATGTPAGNPNVKNSATTMNGTTNVTTPVDGTNINTTNSYYFMWHSHAERELTSLGLFPGGMLTMMEVRPWTLGINQFDQ